MTVKVSRLHCITTAATGRSHEESAEELCAGGAEWIQLRVKNHDYTEWLQIARRVKGICDEFNCRLIVNDNPIIAREIAADGVHLGKMDMDPQQARHMLGEQFVVGATAHTAMDIKQLVAARVDYIGLGPFRHTTTKQDIKPPLGTEGVAGLLDVAAALLPQIPVIIVGGVDVTDVSDLLNVGAYGVAVAASVSLAADKAEKIYMFNQQLHQNT